MVAATTCIMFKIGLVSWIEMFFFFMCFSVSFNPESLFKLEDYWVVDEYLISKQISDFGVLQVIGACVSFKMCLSVCIVI